MNDHAALPADTRLLVLGSVNQRPEDRSLPREKIEPMQLVAAQGNRGIAFFRGWGEYGLSSLAIHPRDPMRWFVSTGKDLVEVDLQTGRSKPFALTGLLDVHEMDFIDGRLWLSNTGTDEAIAVDVDSQTITQSIVLSLFRGNVWVDHNAITDDGRQGTVEATDRFHINQVFDAMDGSLMALVHHVSGRQFMRRVASKLVKVQGTGGVLDLQTGKGHNLQLTGPHSVRVVGEEYWVCDSGRACVRVFDKNWQPLTTIPTRGWGRGAVVMEVAQGDRLVAIGISATRKRYLHLIPGKQQAPNMVELFDPRKHEPIASRLLDHIEQVNNLYVVTEDQAAALDKLS
ncbi:MAG: hypothetical protein GC164_02345 [Phycisphaera sp.]|nr:hypothetical protein [Phycisphaera sp.]